MLPGEGKLLSVTDIQYKPALSDNKYMKNTVQCLLQSDTHKNRLSMICGIIIISVCIQKHKLYAYYFKTKYTTRNMVYFMLITRVMRKLSHAKPVLFMVA